jgi:hypothetical protein
MVLLGVFCPNKGKKPELTGNGTITRKLDGIGICISHRRLKFYRHAEFSS